MAVSKAEVIASAEKFLRSIHEFGFVLSHYVNEGQENPEAFIARQAGIAEKYPFQGDFLMEFPAEVQAWIQAMRENLPE